MTAPTATSPSHEGVLRDDVPVREASASAPDGAHWLEDHVGDSTDLPRGRKGLWGALAVGSLPASPSWLPTVDASALGCVGHSMFDIDPAASIDLTRI